MLIETLIILIKIVVIIFMFVMGVGSLLTFVERKQSAWIQNRVGPNRANFGGHIRGDAMLKSMRLGGVLHFLADGLKMLTKEDIIPAQANRALHTLAPALALFPAMVIFAGIPFMDYWCAGGHAIVAGHRDVCLSETSNYFSISDLDVGFLYIFAIASIEVYAGAIAGWASNSKFSLLGGLRASAQMISYEVSMGLGVLGIVMIFGTLNLNAIIIGQGELLFGFIPKWGILLQPVGFVLFLTASIAESKRAPFDLPEGESELVAGYLTEFSSMKFAILTLSDFIAVVFVAAITAVLFLGGWQVPYLYADGFHAPHAIIYPLIGLGFVALAGYLFSGAAQRKEHVSLVAGAIMLLHALLFFGMLFIQKGGYVELPYPVVVGMRIGAMVMKVLFLCWFQLLIRWTLPRFRYDQVMKLGWKVMLPIALINVLVTALLLPLF
jgi:NADH-quinone oxidoreductase subunit H